MLLKTLVSVAVLAGLSAAQTPDGFDPKVTAHLDVIYGTKAVSPAGATLTKAGASWTTDGLGWDRTADLDADTAKIPTIGTKDTLNGTYLFLMIGEYHSRETRRIPSTNTSRRSRRVSPAH
jgi:hypothetical protein